MLINLNSLELQIIRASLRTEIDDLRKSLEDPTEMGHYFQYKEDLERTITLLRRLNQQVFTTGF